MQTADYSHLVDQALQQVPQVHFEVDQVSGADGRLICGCPTRGAKPLLLVFTGCRRQSQATSDSFNSPATPDLIAMIVRVSL